MIRLCKLMRTVIAGASIVFALSLAPTAAAQTWTEITPAGGPTGNELHGIGSTNIAHYDPASNRLIVFLPRSNGFGGEGFPPDLTSDVWILTNANGLGGAPAWIKLITSGTPPAIHNSPSVVYDAAANKLIVYGGAFFHTSPALSGVFVLTNANGLGGTPVWTQVGVTNPQARLDHSAVYDAQSNHMISFGGHFAFFGTDQNDTRILSNADGVGGPSTWSSLSTSGSPPGIRGAHTVIYDKANNRMTIFAGNNLVSTCCPYVISPYNDAWVLSNANGVGGTPAWTQMMVQGSLPSKRDHHSAVYDAAHNKMIIFGGAVWNQATQDSTILGDLWQLDNANGLGGNPTWTQLPQLGTPPGPNQGQGAAFDAANQRMIIFGGANQFGNHNRVWVLDFTPPTCVAPPTGAVSWWTGDGTATDIQGTNDGTLAGGASFVEGRVGSAFSFDGIGGRVMIPDSQALRFGTTNLTVDAWIKAPQNTWHRSIIGKDQSSFPFASILFNLNDQGRLQFAVTDCGTGDCGWTAPGGGGSRQAVQSPARIDDGAFHHVAGVRHASGYELYVDGQLVATRAEPARNGDSDAPLFIGIQEISANNTVLNPFNGVIDEVGIFSRALSASEIQSIYNAGSAGKCRPANRPPIASAGPDQTVEASGPAGALVTLNGSATDPDADTLSYSWSEGNTSLGADRTISLTLSLGQHTLTLLVSDGKGGTSVDTLVINVVDMTPPVVTPPPDIQTLATGAGGAVVNYGGQTAYDAVDGTLIPTCSPASGSTFSPGTTHVTCTATDAHGNQGTGSFSVTVLYNFGGFFQPVDNLPTINSLKAGRAVPVKFSLGGNMGLSVFAAGYPKSQLIACDSAVTVDGVEETLTAGSSSLSYDPATQQYNYVWKTDAAWAGTCRQLVIQYADGTFRRANFKLVR